MSRMLRMTEAELAGRSKRPKYGNKKKTVNGMEFDSTKEAKRYQDLKLMEHGGYIRELRTHVKVVCQANGIHICDYFADFMYFDIALQKHRWEDCKGFRTPVYRLKRKIVLALTGIEILET